MADYNIKCKKCNYKYEVECPMNDISKYLKAEKCPKCKGEIYQDFTGKVIADIWKCDGCTREELKEKAPVGSVARLDRELWKNDRYREERHVPEKIKYDREKAKEKAVKMGYNGSVQN